MGRGITTKTEYWCGIYSPPITGETSPGNYLDFTQPDTEDSDAKNVYNSEGFGIACFESGAQ
jgi:hypothetical protein